MPKKQTGAISKLKKRISGHSRKLVKHAQDHFIPHKGNNYHPHALKHHVLMGCAAIIILLKIVIITVTVVYPKTQIQATALLPLNVLNLVNQARRSASLTELHYNETLASAARDKASDMLANQYFAHFSPTGISPWYWIKRAGYRYISSAENLAVHYTTAEGVYDGWMSSPDHMKNILNPKFKDVGIGLASGKFEGVDTIFVVQYFGQPYEITTSIPTATNSTGTSTVKIAEDVSTVNSTTTIKTAPAVNIGLIGQKPAKIVITDIVPIAVSKPIEPITEDTTSTISTSTEAARAVLAATSDSEEWAPNLSNTPQTAQNTKLYGIFDEQNINTFSHFVYAFMAMFLTLAIILGIDHKLHVKKPEAIIHALGVIGLILCLWML